MIVLRPGLKLRSAVCDTELIVVTAPADPVEIACGGATVVVADDVPAGAIALDPALADGTVLGKRYADEGIGLELLCVRAGSGTLTCNGARLPLKSAKPLPASD